MEERGEQDRERDERKGNEWQKVEFYMYVSNDTPLDQAKQNNILDALSKLQK